MLADHIGHALSLHLLLPPGLLLLLRQKIRIMEFGMGDLMHQCLDGLYLAHTRLDDNTSFHEAGVALGGAGNMVLLHGERRQGGKPIINTGKIGNFSGQFRDTDIRQLPPLRLAHIKHSGNLKTGGIFPPALYQWLTVLAV